MKDFTLFFPVELDEEFVQTPMVYPNRKSKNTTLMWEKIPGESTSIYSFFKSTDNSSMAEVLKADTSYLRGFSLGDKDSLWIFVWDGECPHDNAFRSLSVSTVRAKIPNYDYLSLYNQRNFTPDTPWLLPLIWYEREITTNFTKKTLLDLEKVHSIKERLKLTDNQWKTMFDASW